METPVRVVWMVAAREGLEETPGGVVGRHVRREGRGAKRPAGLFGRGVRVGGLLVMTNSTSAQRGVKI